MPRIVFSPQLRRLVDATDLSSPALTLRGALDDVFVAHPHLRPYLVDDQAQLRANVVIFIDGQRCRDSRGLSDPLLPDSSVHVLQALSGG